MDKDRDVRVSLWFLSSLSKGGERSEARLDRTARRRPDNTGCYRAASVACVLASRSPGWVFRALYHFIRPSFIHLFNHLFKAYYLPDTDRY